LKNLRNRFERFCYQNRTRGIPNLMLYITLGSALVYVMNLMDPQDTLYWVLCFNRQAILQGQVWRLFTYVFTYDVGNILLTAVSLFCYLSLGRAMENVWGTFRFNLFYLTGVVLMDAFVMIFCPTQDVIIGRYLVTTQYFSQMYNQMAIYLHMGLILTYATCHPESRFYVFYFIPVPAWVMALVDLVLVGIGVFNMCYPVNLMPHALFPVVGLLNYFLFFGGDMPNLLPPSWRVKRQRKTTKKTGTIPFPNGRDYQPKAAEKAPYTHRCTVCGRTDVTNPELEFRYCSRCNGYQCYCEDHISNHTHIE
jgi:membrane associated rhomboid family serine protease